MTDAPGDGWAGTTFMMRRLLQPFWVLLAIIFLFLIGALIVALVRAITAPRAIR